MHLDLKGILTTFVIFKTIKCVLSVVIPLCLIGVFSYKTRENIDYDNK